MHAPFSACLHFCGYTRAVLCTHTHAFLCMHTCFFLHACRCIFLHAGGFVHAHTFLGTHFSLGICMLAFLHACVVALRVSFSLHACIFVYTCMCDFVRACRCLFLRACVFVPAHPFLVHAYPHVYVWFWGTHSAFSHMPRRSKPGRIQPPAALFFPPFNQIAAGGGKRCPCATAQCH